MRLPLFHGALTWGSRTMRWNRWIEDGGLAPASVAAKAENMKWRACFPPSPGLRAHLFGRAIFKGPRGFYAVVTIDETALLHHITHAAVRRFLLDIERSEENPRKRILAGPPETSTCLELVCVSRWQS